MALNRQWWADCRRHIVLLREALLSSVPDIGVLGPLHGCFTFYMSQLHNEVLSSSYARTMIFGANVSALESSFMWMGGWRPTSALVLVYSLMGLQVENALQGVRCERSVVNGSSTPFLTARQLAVMHALQKFTQYAEMRLSKKHAVLQMLICDQDILRAVMLDAASPVANDSTRFDRATAKRMLRFRQLLIQAEDLRLRTVKDLLSLLTPIQASQCVVAVFELCSSMSDMGSTAAPPLLVAVLPATTALPIVSALAQTSPLAKDFDPCISDVSASLYALNACDVLLDGSNQSAILVPSCSSRSSSSLPQHCFSSEHIDVVKSSKLISTALALDDGILETTKILVPAKEHLANVLGSEERLISDGLLILSPTSSEVVIQSCVLEPSGGDLSSARPDKPEEMILSRRALSLFQTPSDVSIQTCNVEFSDLLALTVS